MSKAKKRSNRKLLLNRERRLLRCLDQHPPNLLGYRLRHNEVVFRLLATSAQGKVTVAAFALSSTDKTYKPPRLSVWACSRTTPQQAWEINKRDPRYSHIFRLSVDRILAIRKEIKGTALPPVEVRWDRYQGATQPGTHGHAGILGIHLPANNTQRKIYRDALVQAVEDDPESLT